MEPEEDKQVELDTTVKIETKTEFAKSLPDVEHFAPMNNYVLLRKHIIKGKEKKTKYGLILPQYAQKTGESDLAPDRAAWQLVAVGPEAKVQAALGDFLVINDYDAKYLSRDDVVDYCVTRDVSIMAVVPKALEF